MLTIVYVLLGVHIALFIACVAFARSAIWRHDNVWDTVKTIVYMALFPGVLLFFILILRYG
jgi:hypothetical protein